MKRISLLLLLTLPLIGCNRAVLKSPAQAAPPLDNADVPLLEQINRENVKVLSAALPAVVRITSFHPVDPTAQIPGNEIPFQFHHDHDAPRDFPMEDQSFGSGVLISRDGYVVTNDHVVSESRNITVRLSDARSFPAQVVASDALTDVAVLKIEGTDFPTLPWGNSDEMQVGEQVFAIGDPFDLEDSASRGIISALGRSLPGAISYATYLQTDAAINPGNSGGALVNVRGQLIGINTFIASYSRVNEGVGFALPSNLVRAAVDSLLKSGKLTRGYLGVLLSNPREEGGEARSKTDAGAGALLAGVQARSPAEKAGLRSGDSILEIDKHKVRDSLQLRQLVAQLPVGNRVALTYRRGDSQKSTEVTIGEMPERTVPAANLQIEELTDPAATLAPQESAPTEKKLSGLQVVDLTEKSRSKYAIDASIDKGVIVSDVEDGSAAKLKGIRRGDVIESAGVRPEAPQPLPNAQAFAELARSLKTDDSVVLLVHRAKGSSFVFFGPE